MQTSIQNTHRKYKLLNNADKRDVIEYFDIPNHVGRHRQLEPLRTNQNSSGQRSAKSAKSSRKGSKSRSQSKTKKAAVT